jgi:hypothetical protein
MLNILCDTIVYMYLCVDYICCRTACLMHMQGMDYDKFICVYILFNMRMLMLLLFMELTHSYVGF